MSPDPATVIDKLRGDQPTWIRRSIQAAGLTQQELADRLEVSLKTVNNWVNGGSHPYPREEKRIAMATGAPLIYIQSGVLPDSPDDGETSEDHIPDTPL